MNILQIIPRLDLGGVERGVVDFSKYIVDLGHRSVVISSGGRLVDDLVKSGTVYYQLPVHKKSFFSAFYCIREVRKIILREKIDIVHSRSRVPHWIGFFAALKSPAQFIITAHGYYSVHFFSKIVSLAKFVISPSNVVSRHLVERLGVSPSKISVINRGLNLEEFEFLPLSSRNFKEIKLCFIGRISPIKGIEYFIEAVNELTKSFPDIRGLIAGSASAKHKEYESFLRKKVSRLGLNDKINFLGRKNPSDLLNDCHILVLPSLVPESFGRVVIEAQAKGVVCIATSLGGPSEIIKDKLTGFLVPAYDSMAIAARAKEIIKSRGLYEELTQRARREVEEKYLLNIMSDKVLKAYEKALTTFNILVIKLSSLGDVVLATATFNTLKKYFPDSFLTVLSSRSYFKIIEDSDFVDEVIVYEPEKSRLKELMRLSNILRRKNFDIVIDLQNNNFSHLLSFLIFPKKSIGFDRKLSFLLDKRVNYRTARRLGPLQSQTRLLDVLGISAIESSSLKVNQSSLSYIENIFKEEGVSPYESIAGINVEASAKWKTKNLKIKTLKDIIEYLIKKGFKVILMGLRESFDKAEDLRALSPEAVFNFCGRTDLKQLVALISKVGIFITPDSAAFHVGASLNIPTIGIFGPTDPARHAVLRNNVFIVQRKLKCLCCYKKDCRHKKCMDLDLSDFSEIIDNIEGMQSKPPVDRQQTTTNSSE